MLLHVSLNLKIICICVFAETSPRALLLKYFGLININVFFCQQSVQHVKKHVHIKKALAADDTDDTTTTTVTAFVCIAHSRHATLSPSERSAQIRYTTLKTMPIEHAQVLFNMNQKYLGLVPSRVSRPQIAGGLSQIVVPILCVFPHNQLYTRCQNSHLYLQLSPLMKNDRHPIELLC